MLGYFHQMQSTKRLERETLGAMSREFPIPVLLDGPITVGLRTVLAGGVERQSAVSAEVTRHCLRRVRT